MSNTKIKNRIYSLLLRQFEGEILGHVEFLELCDLYENHQRLYYQANSKLRKIR